MAFCDSFQLRAASQSIKVATNYGSLLCQLHLSNTDASLYPKFLSPLLGDLHESLKKFSVATIRITMASKASVIPSFKVTGELSFRVDSYHQIHVPLLPNESYEAPIYLAAICSLRDHCRVVVQPLLLRLDISTT